MDAQWATRLHESGRDMDGTDAAYYARISGHQAPNVRGCFGKRLITSETILAARGLRALGKTWVEIGRELGFSESQLRRRCR